MNKRNRDIYLYVHSFLLIWAAAFVFSLFRADGGFLASRLAVGNLFFLYGNIPLGIVTLSLHRKGRFRKLFAVPILVLSLVNTLIGITAWIYLILFLRMP